MALGLTRSAKARPALVQKLKLLDAGSPLSHVKAICMALRMNRDPVAGRPLAELLDKPGMTGHAEPADYYRPRRSARPRATFPRVPRREADLLDAKFREVLVAAVALRLRRPNGKAPGDP